MKATVAQIDRVCPETTKAFKISAQGVIMYTFMTFLSKFSIAREARWDDGENRLLKLN